MVPLNLASTRERMRSEHNSSQALLFGWGREEWISTEGECPLRPIQLEDVSPQRYVPWDLDVARVNFAANCGPISFAAILEMEVCLVMRYFSDFLEKPWCNFTQMKRALRSYGVRYESLRGRLPSVGLALVQWLGPWTARDFFGRNSLSYTHWIAVDDSLIFDHTVEQWLPIDVWERDVAADFVQQTPGATGWDIKFGIELKKSNVRVAVSSTAICSAQPRG